MCVATSHNLTARAKRGNMKDLNMWRKRTMWYVPKRKRYYKTPDGRTCKVFEMDLAFERYVWKRKNLRRLRKQKSYMKIYTTLRCFTKRLQSRPLNWKKLHINLRKKRRFRTQTRRIRACQRDSCTIVEFLRERNSQQLKEGVQHVIAQIKKLVGWENKIENWLEIHQDNSKV